MNWIDYEPNEYSICIINVFDDGYQNYQYLYENLWHVVGTNNKGKYKLKNIKNPTIIIPSISIWKVHLLESDFILHL